MGWISSILGFALSIVVSVLIYSYAFQGCIWLITEVFHVQIEPQLYYIVMFVLVFIFISIGVRIGRFARDWIEAGARGPRPSPR